MHSLLLQRLMNLLCLEKSSCKSPNLDTLPLLVLTFLGKSYCPRNSLLERADHFSIFKISITDKSHLYMLSPQIGALLSQAVKIQPDFSKSVPYIPTKMH